MRSKDDYYHFEEEFHSKDRKQFRKERKIAEEKDRSKYKKTDRDKIKKIEPEPSEIEGLLQGRVLAIHPEGIIVDVQNELYTCNLKGSFKKEKSRMKNLIAVGDIVHFEPKEKCTGTIFWIEERISVLSRADNLLRRKEQLIAVNIDQVIITCSVVQPLLKPSLVDRYIIAAKKGNMLPIVVINKVDLLDYPVEGVDPVIVEKEKELFTQFYHDYAKLGIPLIAISAITKVGIEELKQMMQGKTSVFSGQSGVGKSSLINEITGSDLRIGTIVGKTQKGSHTTTTTHLLSIEGGGFCIDTPGIKSFGVWDLKEEEVLQYYPDFFPFAKRCKFPNCCHRNEPECGVKEAVQEGGISSLRFASYCALMETLEEEHRHR